MAGYTRQRSAALALVLVAGCVVALAGDEASVTLPLASYHELLDRVAEAAELRAAPTPPAVHEVVRQQTTVVVGDGRAEVAAEW